MKEKDDTMTEIIFEVSEDEVDGGYSATAHLQAPAPASDGRYPRRILALERETGGLLVKRLEWR